MSDLKCSMPPFDEPLLGEVVGFRPMLIFEIKDHFHWQGRISFG